MVRAVRPDDRQRIVKAFQSLDPESIRTRFFGYKKELSDAELARLVDVDFVNDVVLVATIGSGDDEAVIGGARYVRLDAADGKQEAEVAFTVEEDYRGRGLASRLLSHLATIARQSGVTHFAADVLAENEPMLAVFEESGLPMQRRRTHDVIRITLALSEPP